MCWSIDLSGRDIVYCSLNSPTFMHISTHGWFVVPFSVHAGAVFVFFVVIIHHVAVVAFVVKSFSVSVHAHVRIV